MSSPTATAAIPGTATIRLGIALLGTVGFAISYDALCQMAIAIHIRGPLTYAFPLVIDGFIAIGIGALLILRTAPLHSRLYVWALVGIATATSIWAKALHAVRLNQQTHQGSGLHLDDLTVGALSAIAPLALAGAVHLYLVIRRHRHTPPVRHHSGAQNRQQPARTNTEPDRQASTPTSADDVAEGGADVAEATLPSAKPKGRQPSAPIDELLAIGRTAPKGREGRVSRRNVEAAIRAKGHSVGKDRLTEITRRLQAELDRVPTDTPA
ncbi:DUF2637 domain-containing protein [Streptomyces sp. PT12]|uniref:DUF2637 domain-containing protein n=1 Tax=Streptomyces sp. PT12 TaxID=1510197 RepID=UPI000DE39422|nr:DUF2637 domain-containing protein [Streptomyces sp. PT12]RBM05332.1 hypothetical protein DEH69_28295 [Streptomyces sp. PT12]